jgi:HlyD family secretion protein
MNSRRLLFWTILGAILLGVLAVLFWPQPVAVDFAKISRGALSVSVDDEGKTRVRDVYIVSSPVTGHARRVEAEVGDKVTANVTVVATIEPTNPAFLDHRTRTQAEAQVKASDAALALAKAERDRTNAALDFAQAELKRARELMTRHTISQSALDRAVLETRTQRAAVATATAAVQVRTYELETARASLIEAGIDASDGASSAPSNPSCCAPVKAPVDGLVLRILHKSAGVVRAGEPLLEVGDPRNIEVVVDLLSSDAVNVKSGDPVFVEQWGGGQVLEGRVRRVEPFGFTKVSALGVEEQRVNVVIDPTSPMDVWSRLGHGFRVEVRIIVWRADDVLKAPLGALFREGEDWAVFVVKEGRARLQRVTVGRRNSREAEIRDGLAVDDTVILHPSDRIQEGGGVAAR